MRKQEIQFEYCKVYKGEIIKFLIIFVNKRRYKILILKKKKSEIIALLPFPVYENSNGHFAYIRIIYKITFSSFELKYKE